MNEQRVNIGAGHKLDPMPFVFVAISTGDDVSSAQRGVQMAEYRIRSRTGHPSVYITKFDERYFGRVQLVTKISETERYLVVLREALRQLDEAMTGTANDEVQHANGPQSLP